MAQSMSPESSASKKIPQKVSLPPRAIDWAKGLASDMDLGVQELLRTAVYRGLAAIAHDVTEIKQRNIKTLLEQKLRLSLKDLGMTDAEIDALVASRVIDEDE